MTATLREGTAPVRAGSAAARVAATNAASARFFGEHADAIAHACREMAARFQRGGRLLVAGDGAQRSDVAHVVVEFIHPVVVGKRALPALALPSIADGAAGRALGTLARAEDILMVLAAGAPGDQGRALLAAARGRGVLTVALVGAVPAGTVAADHLFDVPSHDSCIVQEAHELLYHVLWELVHVFFDHRAVSA